jgi:hypothetical protein
MNDWKEKQIFYFPTKENILYKEWESKYKKPTRIIAQKIYIASLKKSVYWHCSAEIRFVIIDNEYYLNILPKIILTEDGYHSIHGFKEGRVITTLSYNEFNNKFLNHVLFWRNQFYIDKNDNININDKIIINKEPITVNLAFGIKNDRPLKEFKDRKEELYFIEEEIE